MKEYTALSLCFILITLAVDKRLKTAVFRRGLFWFFIIVILGFKLAVNGYLTSKEIVLYNPEFFLGVRIGSIPLEDFLFGFSMVSLGVIFWEYFKRK